MARINFDKAINITSLIIALVSLIVSVIALKISENALNLSAGDYKPQISYRFMENGEILVHNEFPDLFSIEAIDILVIKSFGIEDFAKEGTIELKYISESREYDKEDINFRSDFLLKNTSLSCAEECPYDTVIINKLEAKLEEDYGINSKKGYLIPHLYGQVTYVRSYYRNKNGEVKSSYFSRTFIHGGGGYQEEVISEEAYNAMLKRVKLPKFDTPDLLWKYVQRKFLEKY